MTIDYLAALTADTAGHTSTTEAVLFWVLAVVAVAGGIGVVAAPKAVYSAMFLASTMISLAVLYIAQDALFLGIVQVVVYTGAVMMLFLFVLMLVGVDSADSLVETIAGQRWVGMLLAIGLAVLIITAIGAVTFASPVGLSEANADGNVLGIAEKIFTQYVWAFEITSALLITAAMGAMVLAHRERVTDKVTQRDLSERRFREGTGQTGLPAPGVFARHNAVDTPALLPDGTPSDLSVSRVLRARRQVQPLEEYERAIERIEDDVEQGGRR